MKKRLTALGIVLLTGLCSCGGSKPPRIYAIGEVNDKNYYATIVVNSFSIDQSTVKNGDNEHIKLGDLIVNCSFTNMREDAKSKLEDRVIYSWGSDYYKYDIEKTKALNDGIDPAVAIGENTHFVFTDVPYDDTPLKIHIFGDSFADLTISQE